MEKIKVEHHSFGGMIWFGAWLFTLGYLQLGFWKGILAILVWPYFLGVEMSPLVETTDDITGDLTPQWGLHLVDMNLGMGNLLDIVRQRS